jgi:hypothetical protein
MHFPFLSEDWGADEEILLLEGMEVCGAGNWEDIAEHVTTKTKEECEEHYHKYYINSPEWPLPVSIAHITLAKWNTDLFVGLIKNYVDTRRCQEAELWKVDA